MNVMVRALCLGLIVLLVDPRPARGEGADTYGAGGGREPIWPDGLINLCVSYAGSPDKMNPVIYKLQKTLAQRQAPGCNVLLNIWPIPMNGTPNAASARKMCNKQSKGSMTFGDKRAVSLVVADGADKALCKGNSDGSCTGFWKAPEMRGREFKGVLFESNDVAVAAIEPGMFNEGNLARILLAAVGRQLPAPVGDTAPGSGGYGMADWTMASSGSTMTKSTGDNGFTKKGCNDLLGNATRNYNKDGKHMFAFMPGADKPLTNPGDKGRIDPGGDFTVWKDPKGMDRDGGGGGGNGGGGGGGDGGGGSGSGSGGTPVVDNGSGGGGGGNAPTVAGNTAKEQPAPVFASNRTPYANTESKDRNLEGVTQIGRAVSDTGVSVGSGHDFAKNVGNVLDAVNSDRELVSRIKGSGGDRGVASIATGNPSIPRAPVGGDPLATSFASGGGAPKGFDPGNGFIGQDSGVLKSRRPPRNPTQDLMVRQPGRGRERGNGNGSSIYGNGGSAGGGDDLL